MNITTNPIYMLLVAALSLPPLASAQATPDDEDELAIPAGVTRAVLPAQTYQTASVGSNGGSPFTDIGGDGAVLRGFFITERRTSGERRIRGLRPLYGSLTDPVAALFKTERFGNMISGWDADTGDYDGTVRARDMVDFVEEISDDFHQQPRDAFLVRRDIICPRGYAVTAFAALDAENEGTLAGIAFRCQNPYTGEKLTFGQFGTFFTADSIECASGDVAVGVFGRSGNAVDRLGLVCGSP